MRTSEYIQVIFALGVVMLAGVCAWLSKWEIVTGCLGIMAAILNPLAKTVNNTPTQPSTEAT